MTIKLGIAPINWCNDDDPNLGGTTPFAQIIKEMAQAGYIGTELGNKFPKDVEILKPALKDYGLELSSAWFSTFFTEEGRTEETLNHFLNHLSFMKAMGSKFINVCECGHAIQGTSLPVFGDEKPQFNDGQWSSLIQGLHAMGRIAHNFEMRLVYHYHAGTGVFTYSEIKKLMEHTSPELLGLLLDTGHAQIADINPLHLLDTFSERIDYIHLKDIRMRVFNEVNSNKLSFMDGVRKGIFTVPGDGAIDFKPLLSRLKDLNYRGWMIVEAEQDPEVANPLEYAIKAKNYLDAILLE